jgi:hypothetical protein
VAIFFVITIFLGTFILLQLFLAILLSGLQSVRSSIVCGGIMWVM